jgi:phage tail-like protein
MPPARSYVSGNFFFNLDGVKCGFLKSVDGGGIKADVINEAGGSEFYVKKHIGQPNYEDFEMEIDFGLSRTLYEWIAASWTMKHERKNGAVVATDFKQEAVSQREFFNALITEVTMPKLDGTSKEAAFMTVKFAPEYTRRSKASGKVGVEVGKGQQKMWLPSNFRLEIDGLDCKRVSKIDSFTVKNIVLNDTIGDMRDYEKMQTKLDFPNLKITLAEVGAQTWFDWHEDFLVKGNNGPQFEKNGSITLLSLDLKSELACVKLFNLGIFRLAADKAEANTDAIKHVTAELYCERMEFQYLG